MLAVLHIVESTGPKKVLAAQFNFKFMSARTIVEVESGHPSACAKCLQSPCHVHCNIFPPTPDRPNTTTQKKSSGYRQVIPLLHMRFAPTNDGGVKLEKQILCIWDGS